MACAVVTPCCNCTTSGRIRINARLIGYPGILFRFGLEGMMDRSGADLLCLNSADDLALYGRGHEALGLDSGNAW